MFVIRLISGMVVMAAGTSFAQTPPDSAVRLDPLEVTASIRGVVAGPAAASGIPARLTTLSIDRLAGFRPTLVTDALRDHGLVSLYDDLGSPFKQTLMMRGFAASPVVGLPQGVTVFVDGIPINESGAGEVMFELLPFEFARRVEVLSGAASLLGPNTLGGAINLITTSSSPSPARELEFELGSFGAIGGRVHGIGRGYTIGASHEQQDGWRDDMGGERTSFIAAISRAYDRGGFRLSAFGGRSRAQTAGSLPLSVYRVNPDSNLTAGDFELLRMLNVAASGYRSVAGGVATARLFARFGDAERFNVNQEDDPDVRGFTDTRTLGGDVDWSVAKRNLSIRVGAGALTNRTDIQLYRERVDAGLTTNVHSPIRRLDAYGIIAYDLGRVGLSGGARFDHVRVPFFNRLNPARDTTSDYTQLSPRFGITLRATDAMQFYGSVGRSFRPPALIELACADPKEPCPLPFALGDDPPLDPVKVTTYEIGYRRTTAKLDIQLAAYRADVANDIFMFPYEEEDEPEGSTIDGYFDNVSRTRRQGMEAFASTLIGGRHRAFLSYTYTRATFHADTLELFSIREAGGEENVVTNGSRFPLIPDHTLTLGADYVIGGAEIGARLQVVGERFLRGDESNAEDPLPAFTTLDLRTGIQMRGVELDVVLRNALGTEYYAFGTFNINQAGGGVVERFLTPGQPRSLTLSARYRF